jgi:hypothetical protein
MAHIRKHFRFPGLMGITLFIPALILYYLYDTDTLSVPVGKTLYFLNAKDIREVPAYPDGPLVTVFNADALDDDDSHFETPVIIFPKRKFTSIELTGNENHDKRVLKIAEMQMKKMQVTHDTLNGVRFVFGNKSKYESFIKALDLCEV